MLFCFSLFAMNIYTIIPPKRLWKYKVLPTNQKAYWIKKYKDGNCALYNWSTRRFNGVFSGKNLFFLGMSIPFCTPVEKEELRWTPSFFLVRVDWKTLQKWLQTILKCWWLMKLVPCVNVAKLKICLNSFYPRGSNYSLIIMIKLRIIRKVTLSRFSF